MAFDPVSQLSFAFILGAFTFFAPCAYPLLPGYLAYFLGNAQERSDRTARVMWATWVGLLVSLGFGIVYAVLGIIVYFVGTGPLRDIILLELFVGSLLIGLGLLMITGKTPSFTVRLPERRRSAFGFVLFGVVYAAAAAGCTALLSFSVVISALTVGPALGAATLGAYAAGMSTVMVGITVAAGLGREAILRRISRETGRIERIAGGLLVLAGIAQLYFFLFRFGGLELLGLA